ncbi:hypothetical protein SAMN05444274_11316 [Mariniphaga anaerophila]|uniref:Uncharacterized protein n=1 Tax=Mariniphaga anaerophila TaxID=1484053 RepID=A0A1M5FJW0_9BACT|nr:hypothetical protein SAMN05444274_11316 [Mariniphaga anaerophila]
MIEITEEYIEFKNPERIECNTDFDTSGVCFFKSI